ncbi:glycosyltransferase [Flavobacterium sp.]|uniref:glycosyltransferase n=1 Tax=Flavobacterium sp. TaxID=239 RepID=UPI00262B4A4E|nr:glycosyltransferase [Flavobacterium sp.]
MSNFIHFLITRFNLKNPNWDVTKNNEALLTSTWMEERLWFFENFCFPSVTQQSNKNFKWLLFFDETTSEEDRIKIDRICGKHPQIELFYIAGMPAFHSEITRIVAEKSKGFSHVITSRIDNDDAIHKDFINTIQQQFKGQDYRVIDVISGYSLQIKPTVMLGKKEHIFNPFVSLIEKNDNPTTIWHNDHHIWKKETRIDRIEGNRLWIAIIHEKNKVNNFNGYGLVNWRDIQANFNLPEPINEMIVNEMQAFSSWWRLNLYNAIVVNYKVLSKKFKKMLGIYKVK